MKSDPNERIANVGAWADTHTQKASWAGEGPTKAVRVLKPTAVWRARSFRPLQWLLLIRVILWSYIMIHQDHLQMPREDLGRGWNRDTNYKHFIIKPINRKAEIAADIKVELWRRCKGYLLLWIFKIRWTDWLSMGKREAWVWNVYQTSSWTHSRELKIGFWSKSPTSHKSGGHQGVMDSEVVVVFTLQRTTFCELVMLLPSCAGLRPTWWKEGWDSRLSYPLSFSVSNA